MDAVSLLCAVVLGNKDGERIAEILHRQIGKGVDFDRRCKRRHDHRAKAVDQPLHGQDAQVHNGLLDAGQRREPGDLLHAVGLELAVGSLPHQREPHPGVHGNAHAGDILRNDRRLGRAAHAATQPADEPQVQRDIQPGGQRQKQQRYHRVAQRPQQRGKVVVQENRRQPGKHDL